MKILFFTYEGIGLTVAKKLQEEGNEVLVGVVQSYKEMGIDKEEDPEDTKKRLMTFDGMIEKMTAEELFKMADAFDDKDDWSVICDFNNLYRAGERLLEMGFGGENTRGFIFVPTEEQYSLESDRDKAKDFVKAHYQIEVGEKKDFKTIDDGIKFLTESAESDRIWVLKAYNDDINAIVPSSEDPMLAKDELISALASERAGYEMMGYLLEEKISEPMEITPQAVFYDGKPVFFNIDIETKPLLAGDTGPQTGCASNLVFGIGEFDPVSEMAFPPIVYDMALQHKGLFVWDASILIDRRTGKQYFGEFCANRWGWDAFFTELAMCESVTSYFESVMEGQSPFVHQFGASVRMFNVKKNADFPVLYKGDLKDIWLYDVHDVKGRISSIGYSWDLLVATGAASQLDMAVDRAYDTMKTVAFTGGGYRPKFDFMSQDYPTSLMSRYNENVGKFWYGEKYQGPGVDERIGVLERELEKSHKDVLDIKSQHSADMREMRDQLIALVDHDED